MRRCLRPSRSGPGVHSEQSKARCPLSPASQLARPTPTGRLRLGLAAWERAHSPPTCTHSTQTSRRQGLAQGPPQASCTRVTGHSWAPPRPTGVTRGGGGGCSSLCPARSSGDAPRQVEDTACHHGSTAGAGLVGVRLSPVVSRRVPRAQRGAWAPPAPSAAAG